MAFKDWLTSDGVFMPFYPWLSSAGDKFIEHGHRLLGMLAGVLTIALLISLYLAEPRHWMRMFGVALLLGVILQGVLGGMRVVLDERVLALVHGCTGPLFFAAAAGMIAVTGRRWRDQRPVDQVVGGVSDADFAQRWKALSASETPPTKEIKYDSGLLRLAILTAILAYLQLVVGAVVRHTPLMLTEAAAGIFQIAVYFHVILAVAVTLHVLLLAHKCYWGRVSRAISVNLALLIGVQLLLGVSTWMLKYGMPGWATGFIGETGHFNRASGTASAAIVTAHGAVGSLIVALCVVLALHVARRLGASSPAPRATAIPLTGVIA
jgi:cytochrome c oxidase assembly protein subunit 15